MKLNARIAAALIVCAAIGQAQKYSGPRPPQPDIPYLQHADNLIPTEVVTAKSEQRKDETVYTIPGASSPARTPLAEPIFLFDSEKISPESLELYRLDVRNGNREIVLGKKKHPRQYRLSVTKLGEKLYRVEVNEGMGLENGEYSISPRDSDQAFCFEVY